MALIDSAVVPTPESIVGGCSDPDPVVFGLPRLCNLSQISCTVDGVPSSWTVNAAETSLTVPVSYISGVSGSEAINATVGLTLAPRYNTNGYSYRIPQTFNVIPSQAGVDAQGRLLRVVNSGRANPMSAQQTCRNLGGELASKAQADAFTTNTGTYAWLMYHPTGNDEDLSWGTAGTCSYRNGGNDRCVARDGAYGAQATDCGYMVRETRPHPQYGAWGLRYRWTFAITVSFGIASKESPSNTAAQAVLSVGMTRSRSCAKIFPLRIDKSHSNNVLSKYGLCSTKVLAFSLIWGFESLTIQ